MPYLTDECKFSEVLRIMQEIHFFDDKNLISGKVLSFYDESDRDLKLVYQGKNKVFFVLSFCINDRIQDCDFFMLSILKGEYDDENGSLCDFFAWAEEKKLEFNKEKLHIENHNGSYIEKLTKAIVYIDFVLKSSEFTAIIEGRYWDNYLTHWSPSWTYYSK